ncbi:major facilitator superfamily domain-containing protein [Lipomyces orientalis]|uniref:Major facilitator superfamily domain-containing protein n=1 Tax=Lipomyces orientalis TaxID=1233043 RepID=A0ACC3TR97_9ASCO
MSVRDLSDHSTSDVVVIYDKKAAQDCSGSNDSDLFQETTRDVGSEDTEDEAEVRDDILDMLELSLPLEKKETKLSIRDQNLVTWDGEGDSENPKNWSAKKKWFTTFIVSSFTFITPVSSSMVAPALATMAAEFQIMSDVESQLVLSIFILAYAVGPLFLGPLSEIYGRVPVLQLANLFYFVFNLACGFAKTRNQLLAFRFLSGLGGSAPLAIGGGVLGDTWRAHERGKSLAVYSLVPLLGPALGPIAGGFVVENSTWRWVFYATSIADAAIQVSGVFFLRETYAPKILSQKCKKLKKQTGNVNLRTEYDDGLHSLSSKLINSAVRPFRLLGTQPIVQVLAIYMAYIYGMMFLVLSTFPTLWTGRYHERSGISSLNYVALGVGFFIGAQVCAPLNDSIFRRLKARNKGHEKPEYRVPLMVPGSILVPVGLFWYGWTAQMHTHWILPDIGVGIFAIGTIVGFQCIQTYLVDTYTRYAASALAAATVLRSLAGFGFPLFAPTMYKALDYGWGNSVLAFVGIGLGVPAPLFLWRFGETLRQKSPFAAGGS